MKRKNSLLISLVYTLAVVFQVCSCSGGEDSMYNEEDNPNPQNKVLVGTKWTSQSWDYDFDDDGEWAYINNDVYNVYFYSQTEGVAYYARKTTDSDFGTSNDRYACFFKYSVNGDKVDIDTTTEPFSGFQYQYTLDNGHLGCDSYNLKKGDIDYDDKKWLSTITGTTGGCSWYYDYQGSLTISGKGDMANYKSYASTPWNNKYHAINTVYIKGGVESIGSYAFASPSIGTVKFPYSDLKRIGDYAFAGSSIGVTNIGCDDVKYIGDGAFSNCRYAKIGIPSGTEEIGDFAFVDCKSASLTSTPALKKIGNHSFSGCELTSWTDSEVLEYIGQAAITKLNVNVKEINLPAIKELGHIAFYSTAIKNIHVGPYLQKVSGTPFYCASSGTMTIDVASPVSLNADFVDSEYIKKWELKVPEGSEANYRNASYWKNFKSVNGGSSGGSGTGGDTSEKKVLTESNVTARAFTAKLYGKVTGVNSAVEVGFKYGLTGDLSTSGDRVKTRSSSDFFCETDILLEDTKYYYCAYAIIDGKTYYGDIFTFYTKKSDCPSDLTYSIDHNEFKMILIEGGPNGDFYIMQTELPPSSSINICSELIDKPDRNIDGAMIKSEMRVFLNDIRKQTNIAFRLPTKKEWQYAARGGKKSKNYKYSGSDNIDDVAWYSKNSSKYPHDIAKKKANELGLYDMSGNYSEVTNDNYDIYFVDGDICGGNWNSTDLNCTVSSYQPGSQGGDLIINGKKFKEKGAFDARYSTIRLVYTKK